MVVFGLSCQFARAGSARCAEGVAPWTSILGYHAVFPTLLRFWRVFERASLWRAREKVVGATVGADFVRELAPDWSAGQSRLRLVATLRESPAGLTRGFVVGPQICQFAPSFNLTRSHGDAVLQRPDRTLTSASVRDRRSASGSGNTNR